MLTELAGLIDLSSYTNSSHKQNEFECSNNHMQFIFQYAHDFIYLYVFDIYLHIIIIYKQLKKSKEQNKVDHTLQKGKAKKFV